MFRILTDIRRSERARTGLAFTVLLLVVGAYTVVKAVRDAVFLSRFSVTELSLLSIGLALVSGAVVSIYVRATAGVAGHRLVFFTHLTVALSVVLVAAGLRQHPGNRWLPVLLYAWSSVFGVFVVAQFWLLAAELFDLREAKRLFGPIAWGGVAGGFGGGLAARFLAHAVGTSGLLVLAAALFGLAAVATRALWRHRRREGRVPMRTVRGGAAGLWSIARRPSYLRILALGLVLSTTVTTLLDFQLKSVAKRAFESHSMDLAAFFGSLQVYTSAGSLALQVLVTPWLLRRFGVGVGRSVLPAALLTGFVAVAAHDLLPVSLLSIVTAARLLEGGTRFAIHQPAVELSWLALPAKEREAGKPLVDTVGDRTGTAIAGLVWLAIATVLPARVPGVALAGIALVMVWLALLVKTHRDYVEETRAALVHRQMDLDSLRQSLGDERTRRAIEDALDSGEAARIGFALYLLESWEGPLPDLQAALAHASSDVRVQTLRLLAQKACVEQRVGAIASIVTDDADVREAAVVYLRATAPEGPDPVLAAIANEDRVVRFACALVHRPELDAVQSSALLLSRALDEADDTERLAMLRLLGSAHGETVAAVVSPLLDHPDPRVVAASIRAAGRSRAIPLVPALAGKLGTRRWRAAARSALADIGHPALEHLAQLLRMPETDLDVRRAIVILAGTSRNDGIVMELCSILERGHEDLADDALRALVRLHDHMPVAVERRMVQARVVAEADILARDLAFLGSGAWPSARDSEDDGDFLKRSVRDAALARVERVFQLLALVHPRDDVQSVHRGLKSSLPSTRARSIELLDNLVAIGLRRVLLPVLEDADREDFAVVVKRTFGVAAESRQQAIERMLRGNDAWLKEVAAWASGAKEDGTMGLSLVEKALRLGTVDVLSRVASEDLAYIAQLALEVELPDGTTIYSYGDAPDALYVILSGTVRLHQDREEIGTLGPGEAFGSWALFDEAPRVATATTAGPVALLKVDREEFLDLVGDRAAIARAIFKAMVERIRSLMEIAPQR